MTAGLQGVKVLVVEDEFLVAMLLEEMLQSAGCVVSGPVSRVEDALEVVAHRTVDIAILDVNVAGNRIDPVADALSQQNVPFAFVTGYATGALPGRFGERPRLCKPFKVDDLLGTVSALLHIECPKGR
jgi:two-component SAPR family response regulator